MSRRCDLSGKKAQKGMRYSFLRAHFNPTAKRKFQPNLQTVKTTVNGKRVTLKVAASYLKSHPGIRAGITSSRKGKSLRKMKKILSLIKT